MAAAVHAPIHSGNLHLKPDRRRTKQNGLEYGRDSIGEQAPPSLRNFNRGNEKGRPGPLDHSMRFLAVR